MQASVKLGMGAAVLALGAGSLVACSSNSSEPAPTVSSREAGIFGNTDRDIRFINDTDIPLQLHFDFKSSDFKEGMSLNDINGATLAPHTKLNKELGEPLGKNMDFRFWVTGPEGNVVLKSTKVDYKYGEAFAPTYSQNKEVSGSSSTKVAVNIGGYYDPVKNVDNCAVLTATQESGKVGQFKITFAPTSTCKGNGSGPWK